MLWDPFPITTYHRGNIFLKAYTKFKVGHAIFVVSFFIFYFLNAWITDAQVFTLIQYEKVLFLDSDTLILRNLDHLFEFGEFTGDLCPFTPLSLEFVKLDRETAAQQSGASSFENERFY